MKKVFLSIALAITSMVMMGQTSRGFSFQGIARDASGSIYSTAKIDLTMSLLNGSTSVYSETQSVTTDAYGVFSVIIGAGKPETKSEFKDVDFSLQLNVKIDVKVNDGPLTTLANYALQAVPYAKQSENASRAGFADSSATAGRATKSVNATKADNGVPVGTMLAWAGPESTVPKGYLACYGQEISRKDYAELFTAIGTVWGTGDGSTTFNLPNTAGQFLRGADLGRGIDPDADTRTAKYTGGNTGNKTGSYQKDTLIAHSHTIPALNPVALDNGSYAYPLNFSNLTQQSYSTGGKETRPKNINVEYIIKY